MPAYWKEIERRGGYADAPVLIEEVESAIMWARATVKINLKRIRKKENIEQFNLDMLKDEQMKHNTQLK